ncbi:MAG TPA: 3-hydroxyacyl-CoA dehydrogenase NAD-binding domain-containing protein [Planctomycetota bacterium]|nr:3-hydroxyacyl-CoA dehydrogenase NAD-binding domain-containing protein [Planctomycetota bacterium]
MSAMDIAAQTTTGAWKLADEGDGIFRLMLDLPGEKVNKLTAAVLEDLDRILAGVEREPAVKALIIWGGKESSGTFIAGADIHEIRSVATPQEAVEKSRRGQAVLGKLSSTHAVTIAAVHGACLGGGTELALACDLRIASHSPKTRIGLPEVQLGILPGFGGTQRLPRLIGILRALPVILTGKPLDVHQAAKAGVVDRVVYPDLLWREARALANKALANGGKRYRVLRPRRSATSRLLERFEWGRKLIRWWTKKGIERASGKHYPAPYRALDAVIDGFGKPLEEGLQLEASLVGDLVASPVTKNLIDLFLSSEEARKGRREPLAGGGAAGDREGAEGVEQEGRGAARAPPGRTIDQPACGGRGRVAVLGAGVMGGGIAALLARNNFRVRLKDIRREALELGLQKAAELYTTLVKRRRITRRSAANYMAMISATTDSTGFDGVSAVIEAVVENMDVKKQVLREAEEKVPPSALIATNTSALSVSELQSVLERPERAVGLHFFNPVHRMPLVEVVRGRATSEATLLLAEKFARDLGKTPVRVDDGPGFLVNRLLSPYLSEAVRLFEEGFSPVEIDRAMVAFGMPMGPFELLDEVGLDVASKVADVLHKAFGERARPPQLLQKLAGDPKLLGKKSGRGFYIHSRGAGLLRRPKRLNGAVLQLASGGRSFLPPSEELWVKRLMYPMVNEAALALDDRIVEKPSLVDLAMVLGTGFAPFRGGPLRYADSVGIDRIVEFLEGTGEVRLKPSATLVRLAREGSKFYDLERARLVAAH